MQKDDAITLVFLGPGWSLTLLSKPRGPRESAGSICPWGTSVSHQMEGLIQNKNGPVVSVVLCQLHWAWAYPFGGALKVWHESWGFWLLFCVWCGGGRWRGEQSSPEVPSGPRTQTQPVVGTPQPPAPTSSQALWAGSSGRCWGWHSWIRRCSHATNFTKELECIEQQSQLEKLAQQGC